MQFLRVEQLTKDAIVLFAPVSCKTLHGVYTPLLQSNHDPLKQCASPILAVKGSKILVVLSGNKVATGAH